MYSKGLPKNILFFLVVVLSFFCSIPFLINSLGYQYFLVFFLAFVPSLLLLCKTFITSSKKFDPFHPLNFVFLTVFLGTTLRAYYLLSTNNHNDKQLALLYGESPDFLWKATIYIIIGIVFLILGYSSPVRPIQLHRKFPSFINQSWNLKKMNLLIFSLITISILGAIFYFRQEGIEGLTLDTISQKRRTFTDDTRSQRVSYSYYRWVITLIKFPYYLTLIYFVRSNKSIWSRLGFGVILFGILALLFPFVVSSRSEIIYVIINTFLILFYLKKFPYLFFGISIPIIFVIINLMLGLRTSKDFSKHTLSFESSLESVVGSANLLGVAKTGHIIKAVPKKMDFDLGKSLTALFWAPIPRSIWKDKPNVNPGITIRTKVMPLKKSRIVGGGIPPGSIAEFYWNFGLLGIILGMFFLGRMLKFIYFSFEPYLSYSPNAIFLYSGFIIQMSFVLIGDSFVQGSVQALQNIIPSMIIIKILN